MDNLFPASNPALSLLHALTPSKPQPTTTSINRRSTSSSSPTSAFFLTIFILFGITATFVILFFVLDYLSHRHHRIMMGTARGWWGEYDPDPREFRTRILEYDEEGEEGRPARVPLLDNRGRNSVFDAV
ncbi:MAG: hypothetical protein Q9222_000728 [Ikaeria aurantiellina]